ncbi:hypothetical protein C1646_677665 [Rhizophagus diaphanus]|nr:hypothetical protein C1646_677665 [Rhizophagus diaphanus] [Rhizophagus sp. MUCL 43196]
MGDRIAKLEKNFETANNEQDFIKNIIKSIAKKLLVESIYPTHEELRETTREFMSSEHPDFLKKFKKNRWQIYYEKNIAQLLLAKHRSIRKTLTARIKDAMFSVFSEFPSINTSTKKSEIKKWKGMVSVKRYYDKLFQKVKMSESETYMSKIIRIVWKEKKNAPKMQVVYAISICETILNPENTIVQINEETIKQVIIKHYIVILRRSRKFTKYYEGVILRNIIPD